MPGREGPFPSKFPLHCGVGQKYFFVRSRKLQKKYDIYEFFGHS